MDSLKASWLEINAESLRSNIQAFRSIIKGNTSIGVVLKGNAYGHGLEEVLPIVHPLVDCIYLITPQDAFKLRAMERQKGFSPRRVVVLGAVSATEVAECGRHDIEVVVGDASWQEILPYLRRSHVHVKAYVHVDTGLARDGFSWDGIEAEAEFLRGWEDVVTIRGAMSHFANTEDVTEQSYAKKQVKAFHAGVAKLKNLLSLEDSFEEHIAASAAALILPESRLHFVRMGISLYGFWPSPETQKTFSKQHQKVVPFSPVLTWKCTSQLIKKIKSGSFVGYGCTFQCQRDTIIAVFPVGYYDGYPRILSGRAHVLVNGKRCPVLGRVMMNHITVDITDAVEGSTAPYSVDAVLLGEDHGTILSAEMLADWAQTIHYEIVTRIGAHLRRVVIDDHRS